MATDLGLVAHAAEGDPRELAAEGARHRLTERGLPDAGGPDQGQDGARAAPVRPARGRARPAACARPGARGCAPSRRSARRGPRRGSAPASATSRRSADSSPQGSSSTVSSHVRIHPCSGLCSLVRSSLSISRSTAFARRAPAARARPAWPVVVGGALVAAAELAELLADRLELAAQQELPLRLLHALLDVGLDPLAQGQVRQGVPGPAEDEAEPGLDVERSRGPHLLREAEVGRVPRPGPPAARAR